MRPQTKPRTLPQTGGEPGLRSGGIRLETENIIAITVAVQLRCPTNLLGKVRPTGADKRRALMRNDKRLARTPQGAIALILLCNIAPAA